MREDIIRLLSNYKEKFPEDINIQKYFDYLNVNQEYNDRKNMNGHMTVSCFVVKDNKVLMLWHKSFERLMQPGGHIDPPDQSVAQVAIRELKEETGLDGHLTEGFLANCPINIKIFEVKENEKKAEGAHVHFDILMLLVLVDQEQEILNIDEGTDDARWVPFEEIYPDKNPYMFETIQRYKQLSGNK